MRILVAHNRYTRPGGEDTVFEAEVALLETNGHTVITVEDDSKRIESINLAGVAIKSIWSRESLTRFNALLAAEKPDIAHFHNTFPLISPSAYYACARADVPVIQTLHNYRLICPSSYLLRNARTCEKCIAKPFKWPAIVHACYQESALRSANVAIMLALHRIIKTWQHTVSGYIALSEFARSKFAAGGLPANKIFVKPNFVATEDAKPVVTDDADYLLFVGRLSEEKGLYPLIDAMTIARDVPLRIIGDGPLGPMIDEQIARRNLTNVERLGQLPHAEVISQIDSAACLVLPSIWYEGFPMTIVEAFSRCKPVITTNIGSMVEIVEDGVTGLLCDSGNDVELANRIRWAWSNKQNLREMGQQAFEVFGRQYGAKSNYDMLMTIYRHVLHKEVSQ